MRLKDKVCLITGASKGIGRGLALGLAKEGANVVVNYNTDPQGAKQVEMDIESLGRKAISVKADVSQYEEIDLMVKKTIEKFGRIDVLVNNAGVVGLKPMMDITEEDWDSVLDINLRGVFFCSQRVAREMIKRQVGGKIINNSSIWSWAGCPGLAAYCSSKGGMTLLTKVMALELAPYKINVNAIAPGAIEVEKFTHADPNLANTWSSYIPWGRIGKPEDVLGTVVFLASNDSEYVTGQTFYVDGGIVCQLKVPPSIDEYHKNVK
ncbi:MAG: 3-oxoacyl-ACP reductase FabG [Planctomycetes bacterium]|nr:3-oxoacyl-ACP reductase FabG [Planctomycetota bacterium]